MPKPIIVGYEPVTQDRAPVRFGVAAARFTAAPLIIASVHGAVPPLRLLGGRVVEQLAEDVTTALEELARELEGEGVEFETRDLEGLGAASALHEFAEKEDAGLLVVGSTERGPVGRVLPGSTAERLLHGAKLRVLTVVRVTPAMLAELESRMGVRPGRDLEQVEGEHRVEAEEALRRAVAPLEGDVPIEVDAFAGDPAEILVDLSRHLDLLVCGSRGYGPLRAVLLGGVSRQVVTAAQCPVIVLPRGVEASLEALVAETPGAAAAA